MLIKLSYRHQTADTNERQSLKFLNSPADEKNEPEIISTINFKLHQLPAVTIVNGKKQPKGTQNGGHQETVGPTLSGQLLIADADEGFFL